uniref:Mitochondrial fission factor n=1 Tax=Astyanax mexicanus TaxID=7994 RepID=A0A8B9J8C2_ASTMX
MNEAAFPSPTMEMAEMNRIHYELEYTEGISQRMRIPEMLKVAPLAGQEQDASMAQEVLHTVMMHVPDRIVVAAAGEDTQFSRPRDLDLIQSTPLETLSLQTPPRVLTLSDRPLDFLEVEKPSVLANEQECTGHSRSRRERSISENMAVRHGSQLVKNDSLYTLSTLDTTIEGGADDMAVGDATSLRRQIIKLNRRLQLLEEENKERAKREMIMYSVTVAFWLINSWVWLRR